MTIRMGLKNGYATVAELRALGVHVVHDTPRPLRLDEAERRLTLLAEHDRKVRGDNSAPKPQE